MALIRLLYCRARVEPNQNKKHEAMRYLVPTLFLFMYVVPQKYIVKQAAEIKKIHKMSVHKLRVALKQSKDHCY